MSQEIARRVLRIEAQALNDLCGRLNGSFDRAVELLLGCDGRVVVTGMGKSGLIGRKISGTLSSTGTPSYTTEIFCAGTPPAIRTPFTNSETAM